MSVHYTFNNVLPWGFPFYQTVFIINIQVNFIFKFIFIIFIFNKFAKSVL